MICKSCGKRITVTQYGIAGINAIPNCKCGKIRVRERLKGCEKCGEYGTGISIKTHRFWYTLSCTCGHKWRVRN